MSPLLFNIFITDLVEVINNLNVGISVIDEKVTILLYAVIVLLAENESDLHKLLDVLSVYCSDNELTVNINKSKVVHFRNPFVVRSSFNFSFNKESVEIAPILVYYILNF